ncbi:MAG TPA: ThiF family adenylyltransferase, partial [Bacteroidales bacterium]|nr:ThiF family adenylyltransferase [Bacteroidales bacterium]
IDILNIRFNKQNAMPLVNGFDIIVDATDNIESRYVINDACIEGGKPMVHGAIYRFEGEVSVFNYNNGPTYRCYNPEDEKKYNNPEPAETGIMNVLPGITGTYMASEVIKLILQLGDVLSGQVLIFNILTNKHYLFEVITKEENKKINKLNN